MITPLNFLPYFLKKPLKSSLKPKEQTDKQKNTKNFNSIYSKNSAISFGHYLNYEKPKDFFETVDDNWFQLPKIQLEDKTTYCFKPDKIQLECAKALFEGDHVVLVAPTGTGKTAVANWAITQNLSKNKTTYYTTPLIALANDKYREFSKIYGKENVGLLTGEQKINPSAPIVIMTTEIYNIQSSNLKNSKNIATVIFDEAHYLGDEERGSVWENSILNTPLDNTQILLLSATIGNGKELGSWIQSLSGKKGLTLIVSPPQDRYVPLVWYIYNKNLKDKLIPLKEGEINPNQIDSTNLSDKQKRAMDIIYKFQHGFSKYHEVEDKELEKTAQDFKYQLWKIKKTPPEREIPNFSEKEFQNALSAIYPNIPKENISEITQLLIDTKSISFKHPEIEYQHDDYVGFVENLKKDNLLPALIFRLSKKSCQDTINELKKAEVDLTNEEEKKEINKIIKDYKKRGIYLGKNFDEESVLKGYAYHHSGKLAQYKKLVEELFSKKLLKVVVATSTLSAGINMPARTTVICDTVFQKYDPKTDDLIFYPLSANEFHQMAGRAGRRGIDNIGNVILYNLRNPKQEKQNSDSIRETIRKNPNAKPNELLLSYELLESKADPIKSFYRPDWCSCAKYWENNTNDKALKDNIKNSFRVFSAKDADKEISILEKKFQRYNNVLEKTKHIKKKNNGITTLNPKGRILKLSQGPNPLLLSELLYEEKLKDSSPVDLCQIIGYIAGSDNEQQDNQANEYTSKILSQKFDDEDGRDEIVSKFLKNNRLVKRAEIPIKKAQLESRIPKEQILNSNTYSGYILYLWASLNSKNKQNDSYENFRLISEDESKKTVSSELEKEFLRNTQEGIIYKTISQTISTLKQIASICDFALSNSELYPNETYWQDLKQKAIEAINLIQQPPIYDEFSA